MTISLSWQMVLVRLKTTGLPVGYKEDGFTSIGYVSDLIPSQVCNWNGFIVSYMVCWKLFKVCSKKLISLLVVKRSFWLYVLCCITSQYKFHPFRLIHPKL